MHYMLLAQLLILLSLANGSPVIAKRIFGETCAMPVDGNAQLADGRPLFGPSKTIRGVVGSLLVTAMGAPLLGLPIWIGLLVAAAAMAGDLLSSFRSGDSVSRPPARRLVSTIFRIAVPLNRLPFRAFVNGDRYRGWLRSFSSAKYCSLISSSGYACVIVPIEQPAFPHVTGDAA